MGRTQTKLKETRFLLSVLERNLTVFPDFTFYLSAFISAARSVVWVMVSEYSGNSVWQVWYKSKNSSPAEKAFLVKMNDFRARAVKRQTPTPSSCITFKLRPEAVTSDLKEFFDLHRGKQLSVTLYAAVTEIPTVVDASAASADCTFDSFCYVVEEFPDEDVVVVCRRYMALLDQLVDECLEKFQAYLAENKSTPYPRTARKVS